MFENVTDVRDELANRSCARKVSEQVWNSCTVQPLLLTSPVPVWWRLQQMCSGTMQLASFGIPGRKTQYSIALLQ
jgi:hypothetical protein